MNISDKKSVGSKKSKDSAFRRVNNWLHLWLGLISGIIVLIVCITGCIWVFNEEITALLEPESRVEYQAKPVMQPSELAAVGQKLLPDLVPGYAQYQQGRAVTLQMAVPGTHARGGGGVTLKLNPYTGQVLKKEVRDKGEVDFFRFILNGHRFLWLPFNVGRPVVNYGTLIFVILLISGLVWWYPKKWNKSTRDKSFKIKWNASFKRLNIDLHNVLGFYALLFLAAIALTGMVYGIKWYSDGLYWVTTGGQKAGEFRRLESDSLMANKLYTPAQAIDLAWERVISRHPRSMGFYYNYPDTSNAKATIYVSVYPSKGQFYNSQAYTFDQHTLKEFPRTDAYAMDYQKAGFGVKLRKMNYDIHVGSILGFPGKVLAFLASLIGASLPVTGFLIWYNRKFKKKASKDKKKDAAKSAGPPVQGRAFKPSKSRVPQLASEAAGR